MISLMTRVQTHCFGRKEERRKKNQKKIVMGSYLFKLFFSAAFSQSESLFFFIIINSCVGWWLDGLIFLRSPGSPKVIPIKLYVLQKYTLCDAVWMVICKPELVRPIFSLLLLVFSVLACVFDCSFAILNNLLRVPDLKCGVFFSYMNESTYQKQQ
jgi:hypothetical protein